MNKEKYIKLLIYCILFFVIFAIHIPMNYISDDAELHTLINEVSLHEMFIYRWHTNGRIITDVVAYFFYFVPYLVWKVFNTIIYVLIAWLMVYLFTRNSVSDTLIVCLLVLLFPFNYLSNAGWIATAANYLYPVFCLLLVIVPFKKYLTNDCITKSNHVIVFLAIVYISNHDQSAMILIGGLILFLFFSIFLKMDKEVIKMALKYLFISMLLYLFMLLIPGHANRMHNPAETLYWFPDYFQWTFLDKVYHGYSSTIANLLYNNVLLFKTFCCLLFAAALIDKKHSNVFISVLPIMTMILCNILTRESFITEYEHTFGIPELYPFDISFRGCIPLVLSIVSVLAIFVSVIRIVKNDGRKWSLISLLILAAGSREMMGFSGTIYASSFRTFTAFLFIMIISCIILINEINDKIQGAHTEHVHLTTQI